MDNNKKILSNSGLYLSLTSLAIFVAQFVISFVVSLLFPDMTERDWFNVALTVIGIVGVGLPVFIMLMKRIPDSKTGEKKKLSFGKFIGYFFICVAAAYISN